MYGFFVVFSTNCSPVKKMKSCSNSDSMENYWRIPSDSMVKYCSCVVSIFYIVIDKFIRDVCGFFYNLNWSSWYRL